MDSTQTGRESAPSADQLQQAQYDKIVVDYDRHYGDKWSMLYRDEFINASLTAGLDLNGKRVLEAMSGTGLTTPHLLRLGAEITGVDISSQAMRLFAGKWPQCRSACASISRLPFADAHFDACAVVGGLHHLHPHLDEALMEIHRVLKPGGMLCFAEACRGSLPDLLRSFWYKLDPLFEENERSIDLEVLQQRFSGAFNPVSVKFGGNVAYILVFNSMVLRIPAWLKPLYSPLLFPLERIFSRIAPRFLTCFCIVQWRKL